MLRAIAAPGHTPHHTSYALEEDGRAVAVFTGGSLLIGTVGRPDLVDPRLTEHLARAQHTSAHRLAAMLDDQAPVLPTHDLAGVHERGEDVVVLDVVVLDVRRDSERGDGFIEGSVHILLHELHGRAGEVPDGTVWVHCAGGMRAAIAASLLDATGRKVVAVDDSFEAAADAGLSITRP